MFLHSLEDGKGLFESIKGTFVGVGMNAFPRIIPSFFREPYYNICLKKTDDLRLLRKHMKIWCLEEEIRGTLGEKVSNSAVLLSTPEAKRFLQELPKPVYLLLYKNYPELEDLAVKERWNLIANRSSLRLLTTGRQFFNDLVNQLKLPKIPGSVYPLDELKRFNFDHWADILGQPIVLQLPEIEQGGGKGTFFVNSPTDYKRTCEWLEEKTWRGVRIETISIKKFIKGIPASMAICITRHGLLFSGIQQQIIDLPYCEDIPENGIFCGHSWGNTPWSLSMAESARKQAFQIAQHLKALGYKGILGVDFVVDIDKNRVFPIELNPRFTGAFPMLSQLHINQGKIPMDLFHILEFLDYPYEINVEDLVEQYAEPLTGSHLLLYGCMGKGVAKEERLRAGLYEYTEESGKISYLKGATSYEEIEDERQFVITDGPPDTGITGDDSNDPYSRICRLLFSCPIMSDDGRLMNIADSVSRLVHKMTAN